MLTLTDVHNRYQIRTCVSAWKFTENKMHCRPFTTYIILACHKSRAIAYQKIAGKCRSSWDYLSFVQKMALAFVKNGRQVWLHVQWLGFEQSNQTWHPFRASKEDLQLAVEHCLHFAVDGNLNCFVLKRVYWWMTFHDFTIDEALRLIQAMALPNQTINSSTWISTVKWYIHVYYWVHCIFFVFLLESWTSFYITSSCPNISMGTVANGWSNDKLC